MIARPQVSLVRFATLVALCAGFAAAASLADTPAASPNSVQPVAATPAAGTPAAAPPIVVGNPDSARWTATTYEAATSEAHKKALSNGKVATVTGEVVDVSCYLQMGKRGEAHVACGSKCIANGAPIGIVDDDDNLYIVMAEEHHPRRDGQVELKTVLGPLLAKTVTTTGMVTEMKGYRALFLRAELLGGVVKPAMPAKAAKPAIPPKPGK
jgi:hypothetical protein